MNATTAVTLSTIVGTALEYNFEPIYKVAKNTLRSQSICYIGRKIITCSAAAVVSATIGYIAYKVWRLLHRTSHSSNTPPFAPQANSAP